ncbi:MAG: transglutaminase domain-containing protein [Acidobacteria bacterium]|nr:transglutaminase domain-containing protein [Acidobacteriota bacterium]
MTSRLAQTLVLLTILVTALGAAGWAADPPQPPTRQFEFTYKVQVPAMAPGDGPLNLWIPLPATDAYQEISALRIESPVTYQVERDTEYRNRFAHFTVAAKRAAAPFEIVLRFQATRREHRVELKAERLSKRKTNAAKVELMRSLQRDRLVPLDGVIAELARQNTEGLADPLEKARKIYQYVVSTMRYDKSGEGWGHGDAIWACTAKRGNCTDFHSLFIGMMRASGIPARFEIGFPLPADKTEGEIPGYHCWAEFYVDRFGWVPVDASEAWKHPEKLEYFFGAHDVNRVQFTTGRDLRLDAAQKGEPLNYFIYPYAEVDGKPVSKLQMHFAFRDLRAVAMVRGESQPDGGH